MKRAGGQIRQSAVWAGVLAMLSAPTVLAHGGPYLLPTSFEVKRDYVSIQGAIGNEVFFVPTGPIRGASFYSVSPAGTRQKLETVTTLKDYSVIEAPVTEKGTYKITLGDEHARVSRYALIEGNWRVIRPANMGNNAATPRPAAPAAPAAAAPAAAPATPAQPPRPPRFVDEAAVPKDAKITEVRNLSRAEVYVSKGAPSEATTKPGGQGFELRPLNHPNDLYLDQGFEFELLEDGKPLPNVAVEIARAGNFYDEKKEYAELKTDAHGRAKVSFDKPGVYVLLTNYPAPQRDRSEAPPARSYSYTLTFEVNR
ncbi:DUF4198 domain-containing protein [Chitinimonas sp. JJ19]|uniref:DUF4198 domain-containing protein n=1 Tax=Chitinimonas sp. JJ19 TaxID=3109352 RepID=UPI0030013697